MLLKEKPEWMLAIGSFSLVIAIILGRLSGQAPLIDFFAGIFTGLSMALNLSYLAKYRIEKNQKLNRPMV